MSVGITIFILIPAFPVVVAITCLLSTRRWVVMRMMRWGLLAFVTGGLLLWWYDVAFDQGLRRHLGFGERLFGVTMIQAAEAYVIALLMSCLSPWRRPRHGLHEPPSQPDHGGQPPTGRDL